MKNRLLIIGAGGHGRVVADIAEKMSLYKEIVFLDDNLEIKKSGKYDVIGKSMDFVNYNDDVFVAIGNQQVRKKIIDFVKIKNNKMPVLIHPSAIIADDVQIGEGTVVMAGAIINCGTSIGKGCIINTSSSIDHDCNIEDFVHVSVGVHVAGTVSIGTLTYMGIGSIVSNNLEITNNCMIGAGAVVVKNLLEQGVYKGVPAIKQIDKDDEKL